jgi:hypothetical protein
VEALASSTDNRSSKRFTRTILAIVMAVVALGAVAAARQSRPQGPRLFAYGTSYLASDVVNEPGWRYIDQFDHALEPSEFHNLANDGATVQQVAATVDATWQPQDAIVVIDALTNNLYQTRSDPAGAIAEAEPIFRSMLQRLGPLPSIIVVKQGRLSSHDYALFSNELSDATVDAWNAMVDRAVAGLPNVTVVDPNVGWDADAMIYNIHPTNAGEDHIAQMLFATAGLPWRPPTNA